MRTLSIIIPVYNEERTILSILTRLKEIELIDSTKKEIVIVNDYSTDRSEELIQSYMQANPDFAINYFKHDKNMGKGAALRNGIKRASGDFIVIQDADLEYDPNEFNILLRPMLDGVADVVGGQRACCFERGVCVFE